MENQEHEDLVNEENEDLVNDNEDRSADNRNEDSNVGCERVNIYEISSWDKMDHEYERFDSTKEVLPVL